MQVQTPVIISPPRFILGSSDVLCFAEQPRLFRVAQSRLLRPSIHINRFLHFRGAGSEEVSRWESEAPMRKGDGKQEGNGQQREESKGEVGEGLRTNERRRVVCDGGDAKEIERGCKQAPSRQVEQSQFATGQFWRNHLASEIWMAVRTVATSSRVALATRI